mgnify:CR=1 FL=1
MRIQELLKDLPIVYRLIGDENREVQSLCTDSRKIEPGCLFFCNDYESFRLLSLCGGFDAVVGRIDDFPAFDMISEGGGSQIPANPVSRNNIIVISQTVAFVGDGNDVIAVFL